MVTVRISSNARELVDLLDVDRFDHIEMKRLAKSKALHERARVAGESAGLRYQGEGFGAYLIVGRPGAKRDELKRHAMYAVCPVGSEVEVADQLARAIATKHGPGNWWDTGGCVGYCGDDGMVRGGMLDGKEHVMLRAYYFHDPTCPLCGKPCDRAEVSGIKLSGCPCVGQNDRAVAIDLSKLRKDPESTGYKYPADHQVWLKAQSEDLRADAEFRYKTTWSDIPIDPLDVMYDGHPLRFLLGMFEKAQRENVIAQCTVKCFTPLQRSAVSSYLSAELRRRTEVSAAAAKAREISVRIEVDDD